MVGQPPIATLCWEPEVCPGLLALPPAAAPSAAEEATVPSAVTPHSTAQHSTRAVLQRAGLAVLLCESSPLHPGTSCSYSHSQDQHCSLQRPCRLYFFLTPASAAHIGSLKGPGPTSCKAAPDLNLCSLEASFAFLLCHSSLLAVT